MTPSTDLLSGEVDTRPETSPYADCTVKLQFKDGSKYTIPYPLFRKWPKLISLAHRSQTVPVYIDWDIGHTLVHYLFTDTYQCLKPKGPPHEKLTAEFTTSVRVYVLSRCLKSSHLEELAKIQIQRLGGRLPIRTVLDQVRKAYPDP
ncbi:hypothetical protein C2857_000048 [Epichloe festucae Fl1]|uniref:Uncharacterized protein n=1 Tax=Epichloe festucae (strain Fl1) TaxID=877507 RepID=A0A7U3Q144_EPIFF|nr:hypothetical protein C2857_000048 [Epichloe festucae Fl1]